MEKLDAYSNGAKQFRALPEADQIAERKQIPNIFGKIHAFVLLCDPKFWTNSFYMARFLHILIRNYFISK